MSTHFVLCAQSNPDACVLDHYPSGFQALWQPTEGVASGARAPSSPPEFEMSRRLGGKLVQDCVENTLGYTIVSERVRAVLESHASTPIEFLPLHIRNHKGRREPQTFFIVNVLGQVSCADRARSQYIESAMRPGQFCDLTKLFLDPERVDAKRNIFRLAELPRVILVRSDLADLLRHSGVTGLELLPLGTEVSL